HPAGQRDQLEGDLFHISARVVREHKDLSHAVSPPEPQMNFCAARNSAALTPPSPSSLRITPACRGGRWAKSTPSVPPPASPPAAGSIPASARVSVCTGFFFAAMMPLDD